MHWENLDKLLAIVDREFGEQGFYHAGPGGEVLSVQDGVVRTNCMDCLDRTNVVQSLLARRSMLVSYLHFTVVASCIYVHQVEVALTLSDPHNECCRVGAGEVRL